jgi:hypothetical protein
MVGGHSGTFNRNCILQRDRFSWELCKADSWFRVTINLCLIVFFIRASLKRPHSLSTLISIVSIYSFKLYLITLLHPNNEQSVLHMFFRTLIIDTVRSHGTLTYSKYSNCKFAIPKIVKSHSIPLQLNWTTLLQEHASEWRILLVVSHQEVSGEHIIISEQLCPYVNRPNDTCREITFISSAV